MKKVPSITRVQPSRKAKEKTQQVLHILKRPDKHVDLVYNTTLISDPNEPKTIQVLLKGPDSRKQEESAKSEFKNFISRGSWEFVDRKEAKNHEKTING